VVIGGGTGQPRTIEALRLLHARIDCVVAMADDGGSTGVLRERTGVLPPGDVRKCLRALARDPQSLLARALDMRLPEAENHALGNLMLGAMAQLDGDMLAAIKALEAALGCVGNVWPSTLENVHLRGLTRDGREIVGEHMLGEAPCTLERAWLDTAAPAACEEAVSAILHADLVIIGPGSLYTSLLPNVLVPGIAAAIRATRAVRVFVCPKADTQGETWGLTASEYVEALYHHGLEGAIDVVLLHRVKSQAGVATRSFRRLTQDMIATDALTKLDSRYEFAHRLDPVFMRTVLAGEREQARIEALGPRVLARDYTCPTSPSSHRVEALADTLKAVLECRSQLR
jgi:uncharacterized cofD-like protein